MKKNKLIIAAAGSGKTRQIVSDALSITNENVLITTFTEANEAGIKQRIIEQTGGFIPSNIKVQTWFSFLLEQGVRPFQSSMNEELWDKKINFYLSSGSSSTFKGKDGKVYSLSEEKQFFQYYFIAKDNLMMHSDKVAEFTVKCNEKTDGDIIKRISTIFSNIFVDEVQDLAGYDLEILKLLFDSKANILLVGDPRQGTYSTHNSRKNKKYNKSNIVSFFEDSKIRDKLDIDDSSLTTNYRGNKPICDFANKLFPDQKQTLSGQKNTTDHDGVFLIRESEVHHYLEKYPTCMQLRWNIEKNVHEDYRVMNFGDSKGLDFDRVLIYPTNTIKKWLQNNNFDLTSTSRCKFYVAITRARYSVGLVLDYADSLIISGVNKYSGEQQVLL